MTESRKSVDWDFDEEGTIGSEGAALPAHQRAMSDEAQTATPAPIATQGPSFSDPLFDSSFAVLTGNPPFPWQRALFERLVSAQPQQRFPAVCDIPTGLGKTSVMAVWLLALARHAREGTGRSFPRRLVYVVNRRTVVDQSTREAELLRANLGGRSELREVAAALGSLAAIPSQSPLAISTLRGEFADNAEWRDDPARPAIVVGTVDMIGSRLLFSGYGRGFKSRPLHAAFLAQDVMLIHDEAHLEPAFQALVEAIQREQHRNDWERGRFHVMALSATSRSAGSQVGITDADLEDPTVRERLHASKRITLHDGPDDKKVAERISELALSEDFRESGNAILIFVRRVEDVAVIKARLQKAKQAVETLTGTLRGFERERLVRSSAIFARFMPSPAVEPSRGTVYLVCTSAGEVGVNISAEHMICDLTPFDSMAQRFGRVHRFGRPHDHIARVEVVCSTGEPKEGDELGQRIKRTRVLLEDLQGDASPAALGALPPEERLAAFSPQPAILPVTDMLLDAWALTTIREVLPGRPPVDEYLHGVSDYEPPQTQVAWRTEVSLVNGDLLLIHAPEDLLEDFPLKAHELLTDRTDRVMLQVSQIAERHPEEPVWIIEREGPPSVKRLRDLFSGDKNRDKEALQYRTILLPPEAGGLSEGLLQGAAVFAPEVRYDVADEWLDEQGRRRRLRTHDVEVPPRMRLVRQISLGAPPEERADDEKDAEPVWRWFVEPKSADDDGSRTARSAELLDSHLGKAGDFAERIADRLLGAAEALAVARAAKWHDLGKDRRVWQRSIGNSTSAILAKSGPRMKPREITRYRHEFGSMIDVGGLPEFAALKPEERDLILHIIGAHHGRARPHFPESEAFDPESPTLLAAELACTVPRRFARLQARYGRWGLAYLESIVRAADALASQDIAAAEAEAAE